MRNITQPALAATMLAAFLILSGCKSSPSTPVQNADPNQQAAQNAVAPAPANPATSNAPANEPAKSRRVEPAPDRRSSNYSPAPAPVAVQPAPPPPPPPVVAPAGTRVVIRTTETLSASHSEVGDAFSGELEQPIVAHGSTLFARGTRVAGTVVASRHRGRFKGAGDLAIELNSIAGMHVQTTEYEQEVKGKGKRTGGLIGGGAGLGALIGGLAGGGKGAVIGGLAGAGAGTAGAAYSGNKDVVIPSESVVSFSLTQPLQLERHSDR